jgi:hypothetical protein
MSQEMILAISGVATFVAVLLGAVFAVTQLFRPLVKRITFWITTWEQFMIDWSGEPAREGRDAIPGVMERLNNIDGELKRNGGNSVKDTVNRIEKRMKDGDKKFDELSRRIADIEDKLVA